MDATRNDVDEYFDGVTNDLALFELPSAAPGQALDVASSRISTLHGQLSVGAAFARWNDNPERDRVLDIARDDPSALANEPSRLVWEALATIIGWDAYDEVPLSENREAAAHLANELRSQLLADKAGTIAAIVPPWSTGYALNPVRR